MFSKFSEEAQRVLLNAKDEMMRLNHPFVGSEHLVLSILKNARYLLLANSSFTYFPAFTSETVQYIIAPKYWARHNVSNGYWASEQNIYEGWHYMDRHGKVFSSEECRKELEEYKKTSALYARLNQKPAGLRRSFAALRAKVIYHGARLRRIARGVLRRVKQKFS